jgi:hypothetical protein
MKRMEIVAAPMPAARPFQVVEDFIFYRLLKNAQMQGTRNPESGVATNKERLLSRRRVGESVRRTWMYAATTKDEGNVADGRFSAAC